MRKIAAERSYPLTWRVGITILPRAEKIHPAKADDVGRRRVAEREQGDGTLAAGTAPADRAAPAPPSR